MANTGIEIMRRIMAGIAFVLPIALPSLAETVTNVRGSQRENSKLVDIYYDLNDSDGGTYYVEVEVVGRTSDVNASSFSGDVGEGVVPGQNRRIVWDAGADWPGNKGDVKAVVRAIKGGKPNKVQLWEGGPYWADRNIGADNPWDYGLYFWWGDTKGYKQENGTWVASDGSLFDDSNVPTKNNNVITLRDEGWITEDNVLAPMCDAAHVQWGGDWRIPTRQEFSDLCNKCDWIWTTVNGVKGCIVQGQGGYASSSIFLPAAGHLFVRFIINGGVKGDYWSSVPSANINDAGELNFGSGYHRSDYELGRYIGLSIRPVQWLVK